MQDTKTLRMATLSLTAPLLEQFVKYQRTLLAELAQAPHSDWDGRFAFAHGRALAECGLDVLNLHKLKALVSDFAGKRSAWLQVSQHIAQVEHRVAQARAQGKPVDAKDEAVLARSKAELPKLADLSDLEERYGAVAMGLLRARELEVTTLHQELVKIEGTGGHLHQGPAAKA